jgi:hypothetical protein
VQNEPNSRKTPDGVTTNGPFVQNEPNFAPPQAADGGNCAKRSQTWVDWGMWLKAVFVWAVARPGSETCKTKPILGERLTASLRTGPLCKTNPIWRRDGFTLNCYVKGSYVRSACGVPLKKQTQFAALRLLRRSAPRNDIRMGGTGNPPPGRCEWRGERAKQSQFPKGLRYPTALLHELAPRRVQVACLVLAFCRGCIQNEPTQKEPEARVWPAQRLRERMMHARAARE